MIKSQTGEIELGPCISLPYGAAALMSHLKEADGSKDEEILLDNIHSELRYSLQQLKIPEELKQKADYQGGYKLYLSGGGFRAVGGTFRNISSFLDFPGCESKGENFVFADVMPEGFSFRVKKRGPCASRFAIRFKQGEKGKG